MERTKLYAVFCLLSLGLALAVLSGSDRACVPVPVEPGCVSDAECPDGMRCVDGRCREVTAPQRCAGPEALACSDEGSACLYHREIHGQYGECFAPARYPVCRHVGSYSEGWYWSDSGERIDWASCEGVLAVCTLVGTRSEGWYVHGGAPSETSRITWDLCAPRCVEATVSPDDPLYDRYEGTGHDNACAADEDCHTGGCSGEVCSAEEGVVTTCELVPPVRGWCGCIDGACLWHLRDACLLLD